MTSALFGARSKDLGKKDIISKVEKQFAFHNVYGFWQSGRRKVNKEAEKKSRKYSTTSPDTSNTFICRQIDIFQLAKTLFF